MFIFLTINVNCIYKYEMYLMKVLLNSNTVIFLKMYTVLPLLQARLQFENVSHFLADMIFGV